jgi:hypothetical protein
LAVGDENLPITAISRSHAVDLSNQRRFSLVANLVKIVKQYWNWWPVSSRPPRVNTRVGATADTGVKTTSDTGVKAATDAGVEPATDTGVTPTTDSGIQAAAHSGIRAAANAGIRATAHPGIRATAHPGIETAAHPGIETAANAGIAVPRPAVGIDPVHVPRLALGSDKHVAVPKRLGH